MSRVLRSAARLLRTQQGLCTQEGCSTSGRVATYTTDALNVSLHGAGGQASGPTWARLRGGGGLRPWASSGAGSGGHGWSRLPARGLASAPAPHAAWQQQARGFLTASSARRRAAAGASAALGAGSGTCGGGRAGCVLQAPAAHQLQQLRGLLGKPSSRPQKINYQDHNQKKPKKIKIKTRSILKKRIIVAKDGTFWRTQAARRHKRYKKSRGRLSELRGLAPLAAGWARKLRKLGYKRRWWYSQKA